MDQILVPIATTCPEDCDNESTLPWNAPLQSACHNHSEKAGDKSYAIALVANNFRVDCGLV